MSRNTKFPIGNFPIKSPFTGEEYGYYKNTVNKPFPLCKGLRCHQEYICTGLSSASRNDSDLKVSLGYTDLKANGLKIMKCSEYQLYAECRVQIPYKAFQTEWVPSHPQLLAVAADDIRFYEYENQNLTLRKSFLKEEDNPVISMDWDRRQPQEMLITRSTGNVAILSMEYGTPIEIIRNRQPPHPLLEFPDCGARFGTREMQHCVLLVEGDDDGYNRIKVFDRQFLALDYNLPWLNGYYLSMEYSKHSGYLIASLTSEQVYLHDLRNVRDCVASFHFFERGENATCICWSPHAPELYIGTSTGAVVKWRTVEDRTVERYYNQNKKIASIHCPESNPDLLFSTCYESLTDLYPSTIEIYSMHSFINSTN